MVDVAVEHCGAPLFCEPPMGQLGSRPVNRAQFIEMVSAESEKWRRVVDATKGQIE